MKYLTENMIGLYNISEQRQTTPTHSQVLLKWPSFRTNNHMHMCTCAHIQEIYYFLSQIGCGQLWFFLSYKYRNAFFTMKGKREQKGNKESRTPAVFWIKCDEELLHTISVVSNKIMFIYIEDQKLFFIHHCEDSDLRQYLRASYLLSMNFVSSCWHVYMY